MSGAFEAVSFPSESERPRFMVLDDWAQMGERKFRPGVYWCSTHVKQDVVTLVETWFCSPIHVDAVVSDERGDNYGRLLRLETTLGAWREWSMPMALLSGGCDELRAALLAMGAEVNAGPRQRHLLPAYIQSQHPKRRMRCAAQTGWCGTSFVLPDAVIGPDAGGVVFQSAEHGSAEYTQCGTLPDWQESIASKAPGNPLLLLALSAAFAGPMLARCNAESGGLHFVGDSSVGKTTLIEAACSVWGGPSYRRSWRTTSNGLEGAAALFNDSLLALDEISECDPREVGAIVYALGNGRGKQRASRTGAARHVTRWRCMVLSSGERTIETAMREGGRKAKAGQSVRLLDLPAARAYGAFDDLHGTLSAAAFSDGLKRAATRHHGTAGRAFLERLARDNRDFCSMLEIVRELPLFATDGAEGQERRSAARFALIGLSGELATEYGIVPWREGDAIQAAATAFGLWRSLRGKGNDERRQIAEQLSDFLTRHGDARFSNVDATNDVAIRDRAGWWHDTPEGREYLLTSEGMREALHGFDLKRALDVLEELGSLTPGSGGKRSIPIRINGRLMRLYQIDPNKLGGEHDA